MRNMALFLVAGFVLAACGAAQKAVDPAPPDQSPSVDPVESELPAIPAQPESNVESASIPTVAPELINPRNYEFESYLPPQLIPPDGIRPVYQPQFVGAADAPLHDDELVIGVSIEGEAKAYPITVLRFREMVNDELGKLPILVTW
jgi:hypothetical protein